MDSDENLAIFDFEKDSDFSEVNKLGGISLSKLSHNKKLFLFRMPKNLIDPSDLINKEIKFGKKKSKIKLKDEVYQLSSQSAQSLKTSSILIPESSGTLLPVSQDFICQLQLKAVVPDVDSDTNNRIIDLNHYQNLKLNLPELKQRDFFNVNERFTSVLTSPLKWSKNNSQSLSKKKLKIKEEICDSVLKSPKTKSKSKSISFSTMELENDNERFTSVLTSPHKWSKNNSQSLSKKKLKIKEEICDSVLKSPKTKSKSKSISFSTTELENDNERFTSVLTSPHKWSKNNSQSLSKKKLKIKEEICDSVLKSPKTKSKSKSISLSTTELQNDNESLSRQMSPRKTNSLKKHHESLLNGKMEEKYISSKSQDQISSTFRKVKIKKEVDTSFENSSMEEFQFPTNSKSDLSQKKAEMMTTKRKRKVSAEDERFFAMSPSKKKSRLSKNYRSEEIS